MLREIRSLSRKLIEIRRQLYERYFVKNNRLAHRCSIIVGDRGIGKTTTLVQYLMQYAENDLLSPKTLYVQTDHILVGSMTLYEIAEEFAATVGELIAFDEINNMPLGLWN